jgi:hypothetical protein
MPDGDSFASQYFGAGAEMFLRVYDMQGQALSETVVICDRNQTPICPTQFYPVIWNAEPVVMLYRPAPEGWLVFDPFTSQPIPTSTPNLGKRQISLGVGMDQLFAPSVMALFSRTTPGGVRIALEPLREDYQWYLIPPNDGEILPLIGLEHDPAWYDGFRVAIAPSGDQAAWIIEGQVYLWQNGAVNQIGALDHAESLIWGAVDWHEL